jgi:uncharacterized protein (TIGR02996 family)
MNPAEGFLQAILESPADDAPRLVYADWLDEHGDPDRAEFIRTQCKLAALVEEDPRRGELEARERALLAENRRKWVQPLPGWARRQAVFRRGFVEEVSGKASMFVKSAPALFRAAPVRRAWLTYTYRLNTTAIPDPALAACPYLERLTALKLGGGILGGGPIGAEGVRTLVSSPHLTKLETLDLSANGIGTEGARALAESDALPALTDLDLSGDRYSRTTNPVGDAGVALLAASPRLAGLRRLAVGSNGIGPAGAAVLAASPHLRGLVQLDLTNNPLLGEGARALAAGSLPRLVTLNLNFCRVETTGALALLTSDSLPQLADLDLSAGQFDLAALRRAFQGPVAGRLSRLVLSYTGLDASVLPLLAPLPLRVLDLTNNALGPEGTRTLADLPLLENLRELHLGNARLGDEGVRILAESAGAMNLRVLDLYFNNIGPAGVEALAASPHLAGLRVLTLTGNRLGNGGGRALARSPYLNHLTRLRLYGNRILKEVREELTRRFRGAVSF